MIPTMIPEIWKRQNYGDSKKGQYLPGLRPGGERKRGISGVWGIFRAEKVFCVIPQFCMYMTLHISPNPQNVQDKMWTLR